MNSAATKKIIIPSHPHNPFRCYYNNIDEITYQIPDSPQKRLAFKYLLVKGDNQHKNVARKTLNQEFIDSVCEINEDWYLIKANRKVFLSEKIMQEKAANKQLELRIFNKKMDFSGGGRSSNGIDANLILELKQILDRGNKYNFQSSYHDQSIQTEFLQQRQLPIVANNHHHYNNCSVITTANNCNINNIIPNENKEMATITFIIEQMQNYINQKKAQNDLENLNQWEINAQIIKNAPNSQMLGEIEKVLTQKQSLFQMLLLQQAKADLAFQQPLLKKKQEEEH